MFDGILSCSDTCEGRAGASESERRNGTELEQARRALREGEGFFICVLALTDGTAGARPDAPPTFVTPPPTRDRADVTVPPPVIAARAEGRAVRRAESRPVLRPVLRPVPPPPPSSGRADARAELVSPPP